MDLNQITEKLQKIKTDIESAFEKELIDFDEIEAALSSIIEAIQDQDPPEKSGNETALSVGNYI